MVFYAIGVALSLLGAVVMVYGIVQTCFRQPTKMRYGAMAVIGSLLVFLGVLAMKHFDPDSPDQAPWPEDTSPEG